MKVNIPFEEEIESSRKEISHQDHYAKAKIAQQAGGNTSSTRAPQFQGSEGYNQAMENSVSQEKQKPIIADPKINRNDACPCGSGKKYKSCHGQA